MKRKPATVGDEMAGCGNSQDEHDAKLVATSLGISLSVVPFDEQFERVIDYFVGEYLDGRTPNPCAVCNRWLKFGELFAQADAMGADFVATGHYVRITPPDIDAEGALPALRVALDPSKDQSYALFNIDRSCLSRLMFPNGDHSKSEIRAIAADIGLAVAEKPDSQDICFVSDETHSQFIQKMRPTDTAGQIVTTDGRVVGEHQGFEQYTVGQRKGLGIAMGEPYFVVRVEPATRRVVIGQREELACSGLVATDANWLVRTPTAPFGCDVKIRYRSRPQKAMVFPSESAQAFRVEFAEPCYAVAPGQAAVCYDGDRVLGGGFIREGLAVT